MITLPPRVYRISRKRHCRSIAQALSGRGGELVSGRWHTAGRPIVYASQSAALAMIERVAHADEWIAERQTDRVMFTIELPDVSAILLGAGRLAAYDPNWRAEDNRSCRRIGDLWLERKSSCAFLVPSAVVPEDLNVLLNPLHPDFALVLAANPKPVVSSLLPDGRVASLVQAAFGRAKRK